MLWCIKYKNTKLWLSRKKKKKSVKFIFEIVINLVIILFVAVLLVSIYLPLPMFHLAFFSTVKDTVTACAWPEFVFWWIVWLVACCTFKGFWNERGCCSSFNFVKLLE